MLALAGIVTSKSATDAKSSPSTAVPLLTPTITSSAAATGDGAVAVTVTVVEPASSDTDDGLTESVISFDDTPNCTVNCSESLWPALSVAPYIRSSRGSTLAAGVPLSTRVPSSNVRPFGKPLASDLSVYVTGGVPPMASGRVRGVIGVLTS